MILEVFAGLHYIEEEITCNLVYCYVKISLASYRCLLVPMCLRTAMAMSPLVMTVPEGIVGYLYQLYARR